MAELVHYFFPKLVEVHNYSPAHNSVQKMYNWTTLNQKVGGRAAAHAGPACCAGVARSSRSRVQIAAFFSFSFGCIALELSGEHPL